MVNFQQKRVWFAAGFLVMAATIALASCERKPKGESLTALEARVASLEQQVAMLNQIIPNLESRSESRSEPAAAEKLEVNVGQEPSVTPSGEGTAPRRSFPPSPLEVQKALQNAGYYRGSLDGKVGPKTIQAIKDFQRENGLIVDGKAGKRTWARLVTYL